MVIGEQLSQLSQQDQVSPACTLVKFDHSRVGVSALQHSRYRQHHPHAVPLNRHEAVFQIGINKAAEVSRIQFPLVLSWAQPFIKFKDRP